MILDVSFLNECLTYDPETGKLFWKERPRNHFPTNGCWARTNGRQAGREAGSPHFCRGLPHSIRVGITRDGKMHECSGQTLAWLLMGAELPDGMLVDHKDGDPFNNRWGNLRLATISQNAQNKVSNRDRKHTLPKGVYRSGSGDRYRAMIWVNNKHIALGTHPTPEAAHAAYAAAASQHFGEFARFN